MSEKGHIELDRQIDSIIVGVRHRKDPGDIAALMRSIEEVGLLQPVTVTPDGVLVCGWRRLEAVRRLGWRTLRVWVRSGISDRLSELLAQQDENAMRKPLSPIEATELYVELKRLHAEDGARRQAATQFGAEAPSGGENGAGHCPAPTPIRGQGDSRNQAAQTITGEQSYHRFERIAWLERVASDPHRPAAIRELAERELKAIEDGAPVMPGYTRVKEALEHAVAQQEPEDLDALAKAALARIGKGTPEGGKGADNQPTAPPKYRTLRSFVLTWAELDGWSQHYDLSELAGALKTADWERFERVVAETVAFAELLRTARTEAIPA